MRTPTKIQRVSILTGKIRTKILNLDPSDLSDYLSGSKLIQNAFPYLSPSDREFIMSGITDEEWNSEFNDGSSGTD